MPPEYKIPPYLLPEYCFIKHGDRDYHNIDKSVKGTLDEKFMKAVSASKDVEDIPMEKFSIAFNKYFPDPSGIKIRAYEGIGYIYRQNGDFSLISVFSKGKYDDFLQKNKRIEDAQKKKQEERDRRRQQAVNENEMKKKIREYLKKD